MEDQLKKMALNLLAYAAQRDISPEVLCRLANVTIDKLRDDKKPVNPEQVGNIWQNAIHLSKDNHFGLHFGESLQLSALGIVGEIIKSSNTVGDALTTAASLTHLITAAFKLEVVKDEHTFTVQFIPSEPDWRDLIPYVQTLDLLMVFVIHELDGLLLKKIKPTAVNYARAIDNMADYERVMRCVPAANAAENSITFDKAYWNEPIISANYELQNFLLQKLPPLKNPDSEKQTLYNRIYNYMLANSYLGMVSLDDIASNFNLSPRTLQRKLKEEGINFQQVADEVRKSLAINYLKAGEYPVKKVSYMLGYNELSAFTRTFKRWTGITPGSYVKTLQ
jgi:AraC-like DNA-binding protein